MENKPSDNLLPLVFSEATSINYLHDISRKSVAVYLVFCFSMISAVVALYFTSISISKQAPAIIRPATEISAVRSLVNGRVKELLIKENQFVNKGDVLCTVESDALNEKEKFLLIKKRENENFITDLKQLSSNEVHTLFTPLYVQGYRNYKQKLNDAVTKLNKAKTNYDRQLKLYKQDVIAKSEFENHEFEFNKAQSELDMLKQNQLNQWQSELRNYEKDWQDVESQLAQLKKEKENMTIKAPVSGNVQSLAGIYQGSVVFTNQDIAQISPETNLIVEGYINPNDIGFIHTNMPARFQVNAFNYNQWGLATGKVIEVSNDVHTINDKPVFKVKCQLDKDYLQLKNGYKGYLKKGMTLQARFIVTKRTLWQLLFDKADDWLNPNTYVAN